MPNAIIIENGELIGMVDRYGKDPMDKGDVGPVKKCRIVSLNMEKKGTTIHLGQKTGTEG